MCFVIKCFLLIRFLSIELRINAVLSLFADRGRERKRDLGERDVQATGERGERERKRERKRVREKEREERQLERKKKCVRERERERKREQDRER